MLRLLFSVAPKKYFEGKGNKDVGIRAVNCSSWIVRVVLRERDHSDSGNYRVKKVSCTSNLKSPKTDD